MSSTVKFAYYSWQKDELKVIDFMRTHPGYVPLTSETKKIAALDTIWGDIAGQLEMHPQVCRKLWTKIKRGYVDALRRKTKPGRTKYQCESLNFLHEYYLAKRQSENYQLSRNQPEKTIAIDSDEDNQDHVFTLDLETIEDLLGTNKELENPQQISRISDSLHVIYQRIDSALLRIAGENKTQNVNSIKENQNIDCDSSFSYNNDPLLIEDESTSSNDNLRNAFTNSSNTISPEMNDCMIINETHAKNIKQKTISNPAKAPTDDMESIDTGCDIETISNLPKALTPTHDIQIENIEKDMETIFDIHKTSDSKTFYKKLGMYANRFSEVKQEELRLKICCLVTEMELEED